MRVPTGRRMAGSIVAAVIAVAQSKPIVAEINDNTFSRVHTPLARIRPGEAATLIRR